MSKSEGKDDDGDIYHVHDVGRRDSKHPAPCLLCKCTYNQRFSGSRGAEEKATGHAVFLQNSMLKCLWVEQRQRDDCANSVNSLRWKVNLSESRVNGDYKNWRYQSR